MTKNEILAEVKKRTGREEITDIDNELRGILRDITARYPFLRGINNLVITQGEDIYSFSNADILDILIMVDDEGNILKRVYNLEDFYKNNQNTTGRPSSYYVFKKLPPFLDTTSQTTILFSPKPDKSYTFTYHYSYLHPDNINIILLPDEFKEVVILGVCYKVYAGKGLFELAQPYFIEYEKTLKSYINSEISDVEQVNYRDV